jgi:hypothetical protein
VGPLAHPAVGEDAGVHLWVKHARRRRLPRGPRVAVPGIVVRRVMAKSAHMAPAAPVAPVASVAVAAHRYKKKKKAGKEKKKKKKKKKGKKKKKKRWWVILPSRSIFHL